MFNNLIESTSHAQEFKRRGSFLLFTTATYLLLFVVTGVVSIYAYDAHLEARSTELEITLMPVQPPEAAPPVRQDPARTPPTLVRAPAQPVRTDMISSTADPTRVPPTAGTVASPVLPWRSDAIIGATNIDPPAPPGSSNVGVPGGRGDTPVVNMPDPPPSPAPNPTPVAPKVIRKSVVLNSEALSLPKPNYPPIARQIRIQGVVTVQVLIDESGKVVSAKALSGHPLLIPEAQRAALQARFSPTKIGDQPVKVSGMITYNFVMH